MIKSRLKTRIECIDCGKELFIRNDYLKTHKGRCVSCAKKHNWKDEEYIKKSSNSHLNQDNSKFKIAYSQSNFNALFGSYKRSAQDRGIEFNLSKDEFKLLTKQNCHYCGIEPSQKYDEKSGRYKNGYWIYNGVDRKQDNISYNIDNCVPCCKICNYAKQGLTDIEFIEHIKKIYIHSLGSETEYSK